MTLIQRRDLNRLDILHRLQATSAPPNASEPQCLLLDDFSSVAAVLTKRITRLCFCRRLPHAGNLNIRGF